MSATTVAAGEALSIDDTQHKVDYATEAQQKADYVMEAQSKVDYVTEPQHKANYVTGVTDADPVPQQQTLTILVHMSVTSLMNIVKQIHPKMPGLDLLASCHRSI